MTNLKRGPKAVTFEDLAKTLHYVDEATMLRDLYEHQGFTMKMLSTFLGYSKSLVRKRLLAHDIPMRERGGNTIKYRTNNRRRGNNPLCNSQQLPPLDV